MWSLQAKKDDKASGFLVDKIVDQTGSKGTGEWGGRRARGLQQYCFYLKLFIICSMM